MHAKSILVLVSASMLAAPALAAPSKVVYHLGGDDRDAVLANVTKGLGDPSYVLGTATVSSRDLTVEGNVVHIRLQFQSGETWTRDQPIVERSGRTYVVTPGDLPYGVDFPEEATYLRVTAPPGATGADPALVAEEVARKVGLPAGDASDWTPAEDAGRERIFSAASPPEGGFVLECASCKVLVRQDNGTARTVNHARALFQGDALVLFEATPWVDLDATATRPGSDVASRAEAELTSSGYAPLGLQARWLTLEGDALLYELTPTKQGNVTSVFADAFSGAVVRVNGAPSALVTAPRNHGSVPSEPTVQENHEATRERDTPAPGVALLCAAAGAAIMLRRR